MAASRFNDFLKKAHGAISQLRAGGPNFFLGKNGEVVYSKNNVCVHESSGTGGGGGGETADEEPVHTPGYLTIHCSEDDQLGITLILQWLPNTLLEKTPTSIRCVSPRRTNGEVLESGVNAAGIARLSCTNRTHTMDSEEEISNTNFTDDGTAPGPGVPEIFPDSKASTELCLDINGGETGEMVQQLRPRTLLGSEGLGIPAINLIPNTPIDQQELLEEQQQNTAGNGGGGNRSESSEPTSGEDGEGEEEIKERRARRGGGVDGDSCSSSSSEDEEERVQVKCPSLDVLRQSCAFSAIPEQFAREHNLMLSNDEAAEGEEEGGQQGQGPGEGAKLAMMDNKQRMVLYRKDQGGRQKEQRTSGVSSLFSVNLGKMRSMRVFYSDPEHTCGQLVIASPDSQYKIFHFHHTGLDKLTHLFERWNAVKSKSAVGNDSPSSNGQTRQLLICPGVETELNKTELDPEDGLYERLGWDLWRSYVSKDGSVEDCFTIRKTIYFSSMEPSLRKELWPFLLRIYPWSSSLEQRDAMRNDLFLRYQRLKGQRIRRMAKAANEADGGGVMARVEASIVKDVVRTDRRNSFFAGEENSNLDTMKSILLTYAVKHPEIGYIQGMSDLLAPLLCTLRDEPLAYWCFVQLMEQTLFVHPRPRSPSPAHPSPLPPPSPSFSADRSLLDSQLDLLRELLRLFVPQFHAHLHLRLGGDAPNLMFVYRWILLFFKREFPARDALHIWEACWARYRTQHFHLFIACAIVGIYGPDVVAQQLPHDEILLYFSSLAMHMDARLILRKARGLLYQFHRLPRIPCSLAGLCSHSADSEQWNSHIEAHGQFECTQRHEGGECPFAGGIEA